MPHSNRPFGTVYGDAFFQESCIYFGNFVAWRMSFEAGMIDDKAHLAHLVEHLVLDYKDLQSRIHSAGAFYNGGTGLDEMEFKFNSHVESLDLGIELMQCIFRPLKVSDERAKQESEVLKREMWESGGIQMLSLIHI